MTTTTASVILPPTPLGIQCRFCNSEAKTTVYLDDRRFLSFPEDVKVLYLMAGSPIIPLCQSCYEKYYEKYAPAFESFDVYRVDITQRNELEKFRYFVVNYKGEFIKLGECIADVIHFINENLSPIATRKVFSLLEKEKFHYIKVEHTEHIKLISQNLKRINLYEAFRQGYVEVYKLVFESTEYADLATVFSSIVLLTAERLLGELPSPGKLLDFKRNIQNFYKTNGDKVYSLFLAALKESEPVLKSFISNPVIKGFPPKFVQILKNQKITIDEYKLYLVDFLYEVLQNLKGLRVSFQDNRKWLQDIVNEILEKINSFKNIPPEDLTEKQIFELLKSVKGLLKAILIYALTKMYDKLSRTQVKTYHLTPQGQVEISPSEEEDDELVLRGSQVPKVLPPEQQQEERNEIIFAFAFGLLNSLYRIYEKYIKPMPQQGYDSRPFAYTVSWITYSKALLNLFLKAALDFEDQDVEKMIKNAKTALDNNTLKFAYLSDKVFAILSALIYYYRYCVGDPYTSLFKGNYNEPFSLLDDIKIGITQLENCEMVDYDVFSDKIAILNKFSEKIRDVVDSLMIQFKLLFGYTNMTLEEFVRKYTNFDSVERIYRVIYAGLAGLLRAGKAINPANLQAFKASEEQDVFSRSNFYNKWYKTMSVEIEKMVYEGYREFLNE